MDTRLKSLVTMLGLGALLLVAALWGWAAVSKPFPEREGPAVCVDRAFAEGDPIRRGDVTISVLNAGTRNGLAGLTLDLFIDAGFAEGQSGNVPGVPAGAQRRDLDRRSPAPGGPARGCPARRRRPGRAP